MARRWATLVGIVAGVVAFGGASSAAAGGWAVTTVDPFDPPAAGEDLDIGFTILQHGRTPVDVDGVVIFVVDEDGDSTQFAAEPEGTVGRYRATVVFPEPGTYRWSVVQGWFGAQDLGTLDIEPGGSASAAVWPLALVAGAGVAGTHGVAARRVDGPCWRRTTEGDPRLRAVVAVAGVARPVRLEHVPLRRRPADEVARARRPATWVTRATSSRSRPWRAVGTGGRDDGDVAVRSRW